MSRLHDCDQSSSPAIGGLVASLLLLGLAPACKPAPLGPVRVVPQIGVAEPRRVICSPRDEDRLLVVEASGRLGVWNVGSTGAAELFASVPAGAIDAAFTPDGQKIVTAGFDGAVRWWTVDGQLIAVSRETHRTPVRAVAAAADLVASGDEDGVLRLWRPDGAPIGEPLQGHLGAVVSIAAAPDGDVLSVSGDGTLRRWARSAAAGAAPQYESSIIYRQARRQDPDAFLNALHYDRNWGWDRSVAYSPDGTVIAAALFDGALRLWNRDGSLRSERHDAHGKRHVRAVAFAPVGDVFASAGFDGQVRVWHLDGSPRGSPIAAHQGVAYGVCLAARGDWLASAGADNRVRLWDLDGAPRGELPLRPRESVPTVAVASRAPVLAVAGGDGALGIWSLDGTARGTSIPRQSEGISALAVAETGDLLAVGTSDGHVRMWSLDGTARGTLDTGRRAVNALVFAPAAEMAAAAGSAVSLLGADRVAWERPALGADWITALAFAPRGDLIAAGSVLGRLQLWNLDGTPRTQPLKLPRESIRAVAFTPDGTLMASTGGGEHVVRLWGLDLAAAGPPLEGHLGEVTALAASSAGGVFASGSADGTVRLWRFPSRASSAVAVGLPVDQIGFSRRLLWARAGRDSLFFYDDSRRLVATALLLREGLLVFTPDGWFGAPTAAVGLVRAFDGSGTALAPTDVARRLSPDRVREALARAARGSDAAPE